MKRSALTLLCIFALTKLFNPAWIRGQTVHPKAGISFGGVELTIGMSEAEVFTSMSASMYRLLPAPGGKLLEGTPLNWVVRGNDGGDHGVLTFDKEKRLVLVARRWDVSDTAYSLAHLTWNMLEQMKVEGFSHCLVTPAAKYYSPDSPEVEAIIIDCGQKRVEISALKYNTDPPNETAEVLETALSLTPLIKKQ